MMEREGGRRGYNNNILHYLAFVENPLLSDNYKLATVISVNRYGLKKTAGDPKGYGVSLPEILPRPAPDTVILDLKSGHYAAGNAPQ
jgi:hypothetical protein